MAQGKRAPPPRRDVRVYHERQQLWRCGLHATNALLKRRAYSAADFSKIADDLMAGQRSSWFHPHRSMLGLGDYDVNVLMVALDKYAIQTNWVSETASLEEIIRANPKMKGFLVNVPSQFGLPSFMAPANSLFGDRKHWIAVPRYYSHFHLVDSKTTPSRFEKEVDLIRYLEKVRKASGHVLYLVDKSESDQPVD
ncbi:unnamed protein product [Chondrus crispus]|uniref:ubiquitinyl hydrolase 1 n=1 Tax=Chondrus crispus TaxID=2769 RepID=R7QKX7_CHOCR|nr:unnamed protein product [Chondrus crispus]CDF38030.1 unnamed protein product [Chondrus crispus]|eukprot:XP_005717899.1 unnamed protein product [Chondrus crispus]